MRRRLLVFSLALVAACSGASEVAPQTTPIDASTDEVSTHDAAIEASVADVVDSNEAEVDANACEVFGAPGDCMTVSACAALGDHSSYAGHCPGPSTIECCIVTPNVANNPPTPSGWKLMQQSEVTPEMTSWAVAILNDPVTYPMFSTTTKLFGALDVLARVEWHPPDFLNGTVHRGVTLYEPI